MQRTAATFTKMKFCPLIDANASEFSALRCHEMKISQPGEQINTELCHAIFVSHYVWFLFLPAEVSPSPGFCFFLTSAKG